MLFSSLHHLTPNNVLHCYSRCHHSLRLYALYFSSAIRGLPYTFPASLPSLAPTFLTGLFMALSLTVTCDTGFHKRLCFFFASCGKWVSLLSPSSFSHTSLPSHACARTHNAHTCSTLYSPSCCRSQSWQVLGGISQSWHDSNWKIGGCVWGMWIILKERGTEWITWLAS